MTPTMLITFLGGLALFLCGMHMMCSNLEELAFSKMKVLMEKLADRPIKGVVFGMIATALIQSSTALTVLAVGFVNSGVMTLEQSIWVTLGANVGTTVTAQLMAYDFGLLAALAALIGMILMLLPEELGRGKFLQIGFQRWGRKANMYFSSGLSRKIGGCIAGFGVLFIGLERMEAAMLPLQNAPVLAQWMTKFQNPLAGILVGTIVTAILQSSTASIGILQAMAKSGLIGLPSAVYIIFGQNIGTCLTSLLASLGTSPNARRTALVHLLINLIGTAIFIPIVIAVPFLPWIKSISPENPTAQIANVHTVFNIVSTVILLPCSGILAKISRKLVR